MIDETLYDGLRGENQIAAIKSLLIDLLSRLPEAELKALRDISAAHAAEGPSDPQSPEGAYRQAWALRAKLMDAALSRTNP